jgi:hypothetical protein
VNILQATGREFFGHFDDYKVSSMTRVDGGMFSFFKPGWIVTKVTIIIHDLYTFSASSNILVHLVMKCQVYHENMNNVKPI